MMVDHQLSPDFLFVKNFVENPEFLFTQLQTQTVWDERMKSRKTASFGKAYNYSQIMYPECRFPDALDALIVKIKDRLGFAANNCLLNYYPDGNSAMGFHSDTAMGLAIGTGVAIVSLGADRTMKFKNKLNPKIQSERILSSGSLIYLDNKTQEDWLHAIPKVSEAGPRISLSFRSLIDVELRG